jgi:hypothetical protein
VRELDSKIFRTARKRGCGYALKSSEKLFSDPWRPVVQISKIVFNVIYNNCKIYWKTKTPFWEGGSIFYIKRSSLLVELSFAFLSSNCVINHSPSCRTVSLVIHHVELCMLLIIHILVKLDCVINHSLYRIKVCVCVNRLVIDTHCALLSSASMHIVISTSLFQSLALFTCKCFSITVDNITFLLQNKLARPVSGYMKCSGWKYMRCHVL